ncbi:peroxidase-related enzyme [Dactylosporangium roseum]|uniref:Peroxidase-related enzyme n=1 Tax=Dactylosporangium roseum TaxID=47989 RepID=A0ABY5YWZ1_9ACTN|nr:peroxidase-related enzyme [Dactylosporangium roseum]UWZ33901.1 peroxidase-related enzyme [Dactylosporangium roseum]
MSYLDLPDEAEADAGAARHFAADRARFGHVMNYTRVFALRPDVLDAWAQLNRAIKAGMDDRRYELATLAAARRLRSSYCALAHGTLLRDRYFDPATLRRVALDHHDAGLDPVDVAVMDFAEKVAGDPTGVTAADVEALRRHGLTDTEILDVALTAAGRCFFSTVLDAVGVEPDADYRSTLEPELREALTVGRAIAT